MIFAREIENVGTLTGILRDFFGPKTEKKKAYTTTTERKSFGELFWPQRKTFQAGGGYKNPIKTRKDHTTEIFPLWTPFFSAKKSSALEQGGVWFLFPSKMERLKISGKISEHFCEKFRS